MIPFIGPLLGIGKTVIGMIGDHFEGKRKLKQATVDADIAIMVARQTADINWDIEAMRGAKNSWKDEWFVILLSIPAVMAFIPPLAPYVGEGFQELAQAPDWYLAAFGIAVAASFGFRKFGDAMIKGVKGAVLPGTKG